MPMPSPDPIRARREPVHEGITDEMIEQMVGRFYRRIRDHDRLGPIFDHVIGDDWTPHLYKMESFWESITLMTGRYKGKPMAAHIKLKGVTPDDFELWLELFRETAEETCPPDIASVFVAKAENIARSLQQAMFFSPEQADGYKLNE